MAGEVETLSLFEHHFGGLDYHRDVVALFETELFGAAPGNDALDLILPNPDDNVSHDVSQIDFNDFAFELIASGYGHELSIPRFRMSVGLRSN